jgi:hypothetical protein
MFQKLSWWWVANAKSAMWRAKLLAVANKATPSTSTSITV